VKRRSLPEVLGFGFLLAAGAGSMNLRPLGPEFDLPESALGGQQEPAVAIAVDGTWWAIWSDIRPGYRLSYREYFADGSAGGQVRFDDDVLYGTEFKDTTAGRRGRAIAHWTTFPGGGSYYAEAARMRGVGETGFGSAFVLAPPAAEFSASGIASADFAADGSFVATWGGFVDADIQETDLFARRFDSEGNPISGVLLVNESTLGVQGATRVASDARGNFVVVWDDTHGYDGSSSGIFARRYSSDGLPLGPEFLVNQTTLNRQDFPDVAADPAGDFVVVWSGWEIDDIYYDVWMRRFAANGEPLGDEQVVNQFRGGTQWAPRIAMDSAGHFVVAWDAQTFGDETKSIVARAYRADGTPLGDEFAVQTSTEGSSGEAWGAHVALSDSGLAVFAWTAFEGDDERSEDARARRFVWPCSADDASLCLGGRFLVRAQRRTSAGDFDAAHAVPLGADSGGFWFFWPDNLELFVKVLDGCGVNQRYWVYLAGLTDVEVDVEVTDTWTGNVEVYRSDLFARFPAIQDVDALAVCGAAPPAGARGAGSANASPGIRAALAPTPGPGAATAAGAACVADATHLCLQAGRFRVGATYASGGAPAQAAQAVPFGGESGFFWFFEPSNVELAVKLLDGCVPFGTFWFFAAGLTDLAVELEVEDRASGTVRTYVHPAGTPFGPIQDAAAFATCP
jgi:hypothetical protein